MDGSVTAKILKNCLIVLEHSIPYSTLRERSSGFFNNLFKSLSYCIYSSPVLIIIMHAIKTTKTMMDTLYSHSSPAFINSISSIIEPFYKYCRDIVKIEGDYDEMVMTRTYRSVMTVALFSQIFSNVELNGGKNAAVFLIFELLKTTDKMTINKSRVRARCILALSSIWSCCSSDPSVAIFNVIKYCLNDPFVNLRSVINKDQRISDPDQFVDPSNQCRTEIVLACLCCLIEVLMARSAGGVISSCIRDLIPMISQYLYDISPSIRLVSCCTVSLALEAGLCNPDSVVCSMMTLCTDKYDDVRDTALSSLVLLATKSTVCDGDEYDDD